MREAPVAHLDVIVAGGGVAAGAVAEGALPLPECRLLDQPLVTG
jgi:hypothetical protein